MCIICWATWFAKEVAIEFLIFQSCPTGSICHSGPDQLLLLRCTDRRADLCLTPLRPAFCQVCGVSIASIPAASYCKSTGGFGEFVLCRKDVCRRYMSPGCGYLWAMPLFIAFLHGKTLGTLHANSFANRKETNLQL